MVLAIYRYLNVLLETLVPKNIHGFMSLTSKLKVLREDIETTTLYTPEKNPPYRWAVATKVSALNTYVADLKKKRSEYEIRSVFFFFKVPLLSFLILHTKRKRCGQMGSIPCYSESSCVCMQKCFRPVAPLFFLAKVPFLLLLNIERGVAI